MLGELQLIEKKINGGNPAVPGNDEISPSVSWRVTRAARYPLDPPAIAYFRGLGYCLISKVRVSSLDRARDSIDLVAASVDASLGIVEHAIFGEDLVNRRAPTRRVVLTEDVVKIAGQQGRYAVEHGCCFSSLDRVPLALMYQAAQTSLCLRTSPDGCCCLNFTTRAMSSEDLSGYPSASNASAPAEASHQVRLRQPSMA